MMLSVFATSEALSGCSRPALLQLRGLGCRLKPRISRAEQGYAVGTGEAMGTCAVLVFLGRGNDFAVSPTRRHCTCTVSASSHSSEHPAMGVFLGKPSFYQLLFLRRLAVLAQTGMRITKVSGASWLHPETGLDELGTSAQVHLGSSCACVGRA